VFTIYRGEVDSSHSRTGNAVGRYRYRRITALLRREGWTMNHKRVEKFWRREGLKVPYRHFTTSFGSTAMLHGNGL
jgi:transposase InsO family protein